MRAGQRGLKAQAPVSKASVSMCRDIGSSVSSHGMRPSARRFSAISHSARNRRRALRHGALEMRDAADDVRRLVERALGDSSRRSPSGSSRPAGTPPAPIDVRRRLRLDLKGASTASSRSSHTSMWLRTARRPCDTARSQKRMAPSTTASWVSRGFTRPQRNALEQVPDTLRRGMPSDIASRPCGNARRPNAE